MAASLELHIPLEAATNKEAVAAYKEREAKRQRLKEEQVRPIHRLDSKMRHFAVAGFLTACTAERQQLNEELSRGAQHGP
jgi:hypothetical protein